jgi:lipoprotein-releasing system permease protein
MYKLLLCLRYLRTRMIALASIISVTLGVATLIVVNSVMEGFTCEMQQRIHDIYSDLTLISRTAEGMPDYEAHVEAIRRAAGDDIEAMAPVVFTEAMLFFTDHDNHRFVRQITLFGIDAEAQCRVGDFGRFLQHPENRKALSFLLRNGGYDTRDHQTDGDPPQREQMADAGWPYRRRMAPEREFQENIRGNAAPKTIEGPADPFNVPNARGSSANVFDPRKDQNTGAVVGIAMASWRDKAGKDHFYVRPGDDVQVAFYNAAQPPAVKSDTFTIVDFYESKMSEFDAKYVFVPIRTLQNLRGMYNVGADNQPVYNVNAIQMKLTPGVNGDAVRDKLQNLFRPDLYHVATWRDQQGPLLDAVHLEILLLNMLLFLIIAVAGFGILAIFYMIVVEKTRDIGILKSLGASGPGIMGIFLSYGLGLGVVGSGAGLALGLLIVRNINTIANALAVLTGKPVFDPSIYYFYKIPAVVQPWTVTWIVVGAIGIAVVASVLPALRAARMHPVEALRHE